MRPKRKIAIFSGKIGGIKAMYPLMNLIREDKDLDLEVILSDVHLDYFFGRTADQVKKFFPVKHELSLNQKNDSGEERARALGNCLTGMAEILNKAKPDILITLGDRGEVLSACIAAFELGIPIAHLLGGDLMGNRDGHRIYAISKLAHLHFPSSADSAGRIKKIGEEDWRVFNVGSPYPDLIVQQKYTANNKARQQYKIGPDEDYILCLHHPVTLREEESYQEMKELLSALAEKNKLTIIAYPCNDQGYHGVIKAIKEFSDNKIFKIYNHIPALDFLGLMEGSILFIGNSSAGIMETPYFNLPTVNVGLRQKGRLRDNNVVDAKPKQKYILASIETALSKKFKSKIKNNNVYGDGHACQRIYSILKDIIKDNNFKEKLLMKKIN